MEKNFVDNISLFFKLLIVVVISRAVLCFAGYISMNTFPMYDTLKDTNSGVHFDKFKKMSIQDFNKFDSGFYFQIADNGYPKINMSQNNSPSNISFFPLYPLLIRAARLLHFSSNNIINSLLLSNVLLIFALYYLYKLCELREFSRNEAYLTITLILFYPTSIYYSVPYTESLFLFLSAAAIYYSAKSDYLKASIFAALSAVTRFPGFLNIAYVFFIMLTEEDLKSHASSYIKKIIGYMIIAVIPLILYFSYMKYLTGDFLAPLHDEKNWSRKLSIPFKSYIDYIKKPYFFSGGGWSNGLICFAVATVVLSAFIFYIIKNYKKLNLRELILFIYGFLVITVPFSNTGSDLVSIPRYLMVSIPMYFYIVELYREKQFMFIGYMFFFAIINAIMTIGYFNGYRFVV